MRILVTGANGFIGKNLCLHLKNYAEIEVLHIVSESSDSELELALNKAEFIFHLGGVNRPENPVDFHIGNTTSTQSICNLLIANKRSVPIVYSSSIQALLDNEYGRSKLAAEVALNKYSEESGAKVFIFRLPNVFGKWSRPNYNSAVATFCYNIARDLPIKVNDPTAELRLVYVDDVIRTFISLIHSTNTRSGIQDIQPVYSTTIANLVDQLEIFKKSRNSLVTERVGTGFLRALYATYVSYLPKEKFSYEITKHIDARGEFVEMLKTQDSGQFSFFTAYPGITRGGHYHHSKTEKFLVIKGKAQFRFRNMISGETYDIVTEGNKPIIVETVPGWTHDVTNIGNDEMIVMLWANEIFDREHPDTITEKV